jgi:hypothetical protein
VANLEGLHGSQWRSDLVARNAGSQAAAVVLRLHAGADTATMSVLVEPGDQAVFEDLVGLMGRTGKGALEVLSNQPLQVSGRTYNIGPNGTFGQLLETQSDQGGLDAGDRVWLLHLRQLGDEFRTNLVLTNTGEQQAETSVRLFDSSGSEIDSFHLAVEPGSMALDIEPIRLRAGRPHLGWGFATVSVIEGNGVFASASVIDSRTNDPTTVPMVR